MSDYPPAPPYGASYGSQPQTNPPYLQPTYPNQYMQQDDGRAAQTHMTSNYDTSMSAYGYNNSIPGFNAGSLASAAPPLPIYQGWNQDTIPLPSYSTPHNNMQYTGYGGNPYQTQQSYPAPQPQTYHQNTQHVTPYDEGELSEGEFDAYGGQHSGGTAAADYGSNYYQGNDGTGFMNTAHRAVYPNQDYSNQQYSSGNGYYHRESPQAGRQQSDSYSPYAGNSTQQDYQQPSWMQNNSAPESTLPIGTIAPQTKNQSLKSVERSPAVAQPATAVKASEPNVQHNSTMHDAQDGITNTPVVQRSPLIQPVGGRISEDEGTNSSPPIAQQTPTTQTGFPKSVAEARKKAEGAILNLWPYEVRFPNYVEEGLDETVVGRLFDDLGFARTPSKAAISIAEAKSTVDKPNGTSPENGVSESLKSYERSNEEARGILMENNGNRVNNSAATNSTSLATPAKTEPTEKEKNLKLKMEMLRKSREERAQKAAAKNNTVPSNGTASSVPSTAPQPESPTSTADIPDSLTTSPLPPILPPTTVQLPSSSSATQPMPPTTTFKPTSFSSTAQPIPPPQPVIPGLFLASTSSPAPSTASQNAMLAAPQSNQRKRPVAADFDTPTSTMPFKRPFGQSRSDSLVIDVSEDEPDSEDEDVAMDLESQADQDSPVQSARKMSDQRIATIQNLPPLTNFPSRKVFTSPPISSAASTPPVHTASKSTLGHPHVLQQKETEIELLKKKIAEAEAAKAAKRRAQQTSSGAATPQRQPANGTSGAANGNGDIASKVEASIQMQQLIGIAEDKVSSDQKRLAATQAAELEKAAELKRNEAESRRLRREKIATDLPRVDAEVEQSQLKLQQLREEMAKIEAAVQKSLEDKRRMAEEMERLGQEAEDQLQEQKDKLKDLTSAESASTSGSPQQVSLPEQATLSSGSISSNPGPTSTNSSPPPDTSGQEEAMLPSQISVPTANSMSHCSPFVEVPSQKKLLESSDGITSDQALEAALQKQVRAEADSHEVGKEDIDIEDSYTSDPAQLVPESGSSPNSVVEGTLAIPESQPRADVAEAQKVQPNSRTDMEIGQDDENDDYEPPEATPPADMPSPIESPPFSPAPPESVTDFEQFSSARHGLEHIVEDNEDLQVNGSVSQLIEGGDKSSNQIQFFTPYESPLKYFRAFRFHPDYKQEVSGGLKSMTYSHTIDPNTEFCRYELAGGVCNDKSCEFQHFRDIALPEDSILSALGSPEEFPADQQQKFREGLRHVLTDLRARKVRDFNTIAAEVVAHRSKFLGDPSKVLMLEGTTI